MADKPAAAGKSSFDLIDRAELMAALAPAPGMVYADLACGPGRYALALAEEVGAEGRVYALDLWADGIDALQKEIDRQRLPNIQPLRADITKPLPLEPEIMDGCLLAAILHDLAEQERAAVLGETARLLKPGGTLAVVEFRQTDQGPGPPAHIRLAADDVEKAASAAGFARLDVRDLGPYNYLMLLAPKGQGPRGTAGQPA